MSKSSLSINDSFNPIILRNVLVRHWYKPLIIFAVILVGVFIYLRYSKPVYESQAVLQIIQENRTQQILGEASVMSQQHSLSEDVELLKSPVLFHNAIQNLSLHTFSFNDGKLITENLYGFTPYSIITNQLADSGLCGTNLYFEATGGRSFNLNYKYRGKDYSIHGSLS
ncbi:MAG: Wzz/FepE/Etk N-terminal domain-containing protein, partial [Bacteroidota bacterium]